MVSVHSAAKRNRGTVLFYLFYEFWREMPYSCNKDGKARIYEQGTDLMMLPQKKEGWIIIHKEAIYDKETAEKIAKETTANVIRIQKIEWEE